MSIAVQVPNRIAIARTIDFVLITSLNKHPDGCLLERDKAGFVLGGFCCMWHLSEFVIYAVPMLIIIYEYNDYSHNTQYKT